MVAMRLLAGEEEHGGLRPVVSSGGSGERLRSQDDYLGLVENKELVIYYHARDSHDVLYHLMGALLAENGVANILSDSAAKGRHLPVSKPEPPNEKSPIIGGVDHTTFDIVNIWQGLPTGDIASPTNELRRSLTDIVQAAQLTDKYPQEAIDQAVTAQVAFMANLRSKNLFTPSPSGA